MGKTPLLKVNLKSVDNGRYNPVPMSLVSDLRDEYGLRWVKFPPPFDILTLA